MAYMPHPTSKKSMKLNKIFKSSQILENECSVISKRSEWTQETRGFNIKNRIWIQPLSSFISNNSSIIIIISNFKNNRNYSLSPINLEITSTIWAMKIKPHNYLNIPNLEFSSPNISNKGTNMISTMELKVIEIC